MQIKAVVENILKPYSAVLFLNNKIAGALILAITMLNYSVGLSGFIATLTTLLFAWLMGLKEEYLSKGFYVYNSLLVGMGIGYIFLPTLTSIFLVIVSAAFTFIFSFMLNRLFSTYNMPVLSLPFSIISILVYLGALKYSALLGTIVHNAVLFDINLPDNLRHYLKSVGTIYFLPSSIAGLALLLIILYFSRIMFIVAFIGYHFGVLLHALLLGSLEQSIAYPYNFNYILVAVALCGVFLLPTLKNFFIMLIAVAVSVIIGDAIEILFNYYNIPVFTMPFNIVVIAFIFTLYMVAYSEFNYNIKSTPEESLLSYVSSLFRFGKVVPKISLPFSGEWKVYQAFDDEWTHKGEYKYAYDFIKELDGKSYKNDGLELSDYYCFGEPILAPVSGYVVDLRDNLPDNFIGEVDRINNWGNYIIIKSDLGFFVEISHLMQHSLKVKIGEYIKEGQIIARCGNSGYSPQPHIHIQVQYLGVINSFTREFLFKDFVYENRLYFNALPKKNSFVKSVRVDYIIKSKLTFVLDDEFFYKVYKNSKHIEDISFKVKMNNFGEFYFCDSKDNKLFFFSDERLFYFYKYEGKKDSYLSKIFILAPKYPYFNVDNLEFIDYTPSYLYYSKLKNILLELSATIKKSNILIKKSYNIKRDSLESKDGRVELSKSFKFFDLIRFNDTILERIEK